MGESASLSDARRDYRVVVFFGATEAEFDGLQDTVMDAVTEALGCTDVDHECPHFQCAFSGPRNGGRRRAIRFALRDLWEAVRYGEV
jgi:hypothetical protein